MKRNLIESGQKYLKIVLFYIRARCGQPISDLARSPTKSVFALESWLSEVTPTMRFAAAVAGRLRIRQTSKLDPQQRAPNVIFTIGFLSLPSKVG